MLPRALRALAGVTLCVTGAACFSELPDETTGPGDGEATVVEMQDFRFDPAVVRIQAGGAVEWRNVSTSTHTATADPSLAANPANVALPSSGAGFHSGDVTPGRQFRRTFTERGTYRYVCLPHESIAMFGTVIVE